MDGIDLIKSNVLSNDPFLHLASPFSGSKASTNSSALQTILRAKHIACDDVVVDHGGLVTNEQHSHSKV
jgi:hypothetical protein